MRIYTADPGISISGIEDENIKPLMICPLSLEKNEIDLTSLKKGKFVLVTIDYKNQVYLQKILHRN